MFRTIRARLLASALALGSAALVAPVVHAAPPAAAAGPATSYLKGKHETVQKILAGPKGPERDKKVDAELATLIDYDEMAKVALGDNWAKRSADEQKKFTGILQKLIEKSYKKRLDQTADYFIDYKGEELNKAGDSVVHTEAKNLKDKREAPVQIDYVLRKKNGNWIVVDLVPEQSSMAKTYNKEFTKVLAKESWEALIKKMEDKLAKS